jgi:G:T-mismatch repair DNA endonuclease (very short patch repair protein)
MPKGIYLRTKAHRKSLALASMGNRSHLGCKHSEQTRALMRKNHKGTLGMRFPNRIYHFSEEALLRIAESSKQRWQNPSYKQKVVRAQMKARQRKPNVPELKLDELLQKVLPNQYKYIGDGQVILGGRCPDFINIDGEKKVIELFGTFWHPIFDVAQRVEHYRSYGFSTLIIWEDELSDEPKLVRKIKHFAKKMAEE